MRRGEVWWADLAPPAGPRPVLLVSRDEAYAVREFVTVAPVSTRIRRIPTEVLVGTAEGLPRTGAANCDSLTTIAKARLRHRMGVLSAEKVRGLDLAIHFALGLEE